MGRGETSFTTPSLHPPPRCLKNFQGSCAHCLAADADLERQTDWSRSHTAPSSSALGPHRRDHEGSTALPPVLTSSSIYPKAGGLVIVDRPYT